MRRSNHYAHDSVRAEFTQLQPLHAGPAENAAPSAPPWPSTESLGTPDPRPGYSPNGVRYSTQAPVFRGRAGQSTPAHPAAPRRPAPQSTPATLASLLDPGRTAAGGAAGSDAAGDPGQFHRHDDYQRTESTGVDHHRLSALREIKQSLAPENQRAVDNLVRYHANAAAGPRNYDLLGPYQVPHDPDSDTLIGLHRRASFLLIKDVLDDTGRLVAEHQTCFPHPEFDQAERLLLTAQLGAIRSQARKLRDAELAKLAQGQLAIPMMLQKPRFKQFLSANRPTLEMLVGSCQLDGAQRKETQGALLTDLACRYLGASDRLPKGLPPGAIFRARADLEFTEGLVHVHVDDIANLVMPVQEPPEYMGVIVLNNDACPHPWSDPQDPANPDGAMAAPFAHCDLPVKQAAALLLKFFGDLTHLEMSIAQCKQERAPRPGPVPLTASMAVDYLYRGSTELGDRHGFNLKGFFDQRDPVTEAITPVATQARAYAQTHGAPLICEPDLEAWCASPAFENDLFQIRLPTARLRLLALEAATEVMLEDRLFAPLRRPPQR